jgi:hypothetical protein
LYSFGVYGTLMPTISFPADFILAGTSVDSDAFALTVGVAVLVGPPAFSLLLAQPDTTSPVAAHMAATA